MHSPEFIHREYTRIRNQEQLDGRALEILVNVYGAEAVANYFNWYAEQIREGSIPGKESEQGLGDSGTLLNS